MYYQFSLIKSLSKWTIITWSFSGRHINTIWFCILVVVKGMKNKRDGIPSTWVKSVDHIPPTDVTSTKCARLNFIQMKGAYLLGHLSVLFMTTQSNSTAFSFIGAHNRIGDHCLPPAMYYSPQAQGFPQMLEASQPSGSSLSGSWVTTATAGYGSTGRSTTGDEHGEPKAQRWRNAHPHLNQAPMSIGRFWACRVRSRNPL